MRSVSKYLVVVFALLAIVLTSSAVSANEALSGKFTLPHATQWDNTVLPAGSYTFTLAHSQTQNVNVLAVHGKNRKVSLFVRGEWSCESCQSATINLALRGDRYAVTSMNVAGFHANFKVRQPNGSTDAELKAPQATEQIAVQVNPN
jgi:hypothetical protein